MTPGPGLTQDPRDRPRPRRWHPAHVARHFFERGNARTTARLAPLRPDDVVSLHDVVVEPSDPDSRLDVHRPDPALDPGAPPPPTVVWVHGGGWLAGHRRDAAAYARILAAHGFAVVCVGYSIAPEARYPTPVRQVAAAVRHLVEHADALGLDGSRLALAGDSAGAQVAAQVALLTTDRDYAEALGIPAPVEPDALRAVVLHCGPYATAHARSPMSRAVLGWYAGRRGRRDPALVALASVLDHVTASFPPAYLAVGNDDPLRSHSYALADRLAELDVATTTAFYPDEYEPRLGHEFQLDLTRSDEARNVLAGTVTFLADRLRPPATP